MSNLPPAYDGPQENVPPYAGNSDISARWHMINTPAKGLYGSRGLSLVSDNAAITSPGITTSVPGYDLLFVDGLTIEVHPKAPFPGPESSDKPWKTPVIATVKFAAEDPTKASIAFTKKDMSTIIVDSTHLRTGIFRVGDVDPNEVRLVNLYHTSRDRLPIAWSIENNKDILPATSTPETLAAEKPAQEPSPEINTTQSGSKKSDKWSWKSISKDIIPKDLAKPKDHKRSKSNAAEEEKTQRQREGLSTHFTLLDASGHIYAHFANEFLKDPSKTSKIPTYEKDIKHHKSWGHIDIHDPHLMAIRSSYPAFEKWSETDLELVVLLTLVIILEVNLKIYGGVSRESVYSQAVFAGGFSEVNVGKMGAASAAIGAVADGMQWMIRGIGNS